ncbi:hypothetical protein ACFSHQ_10745 [Gemmobacter lanyuensis]
MTFLRPATPALLLLFAAACSPQTMADNVTDRAARSVVVPVMQNYMPAPRPKPRRIACSPMPRSRNAGRWPATWGARRDADGAECRDHRATPRHRGLHARARHRSAWG